MKKYIPILLVCLFAITVYSNTLSNEFVFDDLKTIEHNESIRNLSNVRNIWQNNPTRFVSYLSFALNYRISKLDVTSYHITNLIVHTLAGISVFVFLSLLLQTPKLTDKKKIFSKLPFLGSLLFIVHPVQTQAVTYITQRIASMGALFYILSLVFFLKLSLQTDKPKKLKVVLFAAFTIIFALLAFFTKENTFTLPLAIILVHFSFFTSYKKNILKKSIVIVPVAVVASFMALTSHAYWAYFSKLEFRKLLSSLNFLDISNATINKFEISYFFTQFKVITYYVFLFLFPVKQNLDYDFPISKSLFEPATFTSLVAIIALVLIGISLRKKNPLASFGILFFFIALSVESSIFPLTDVIYEHRLYLPSLGLVVVVAATFCQLQNFISKRLQVNNDKKASYKRISRFALFSIVFLLSLATVSRNRTWNTQISIWTDTVAKSPDKARPYYNLGYAYSKDKQYTYAVEAYKTAVAINPMYEDYRNLGINLYHLGHPESAIENYLKAAELRPNNYEVLNDLGFVYISIEKFDLAKAYFEKSIGIEENPVAYEGLKTANELNKKPVDASK